MTLETITINLVGRAVLKVHEGREYLVAPGTSIVPGVLHGSEGPLFYPHKQIARNYKDWDDTAITIYHPTNDFNIPASAKDISVLKKHGIGIIKNTTIGTIGQLQHDLWFDVEYTKNADKRYGTDIYGRLSRGEPIELSTGLYTKNEPRKGAYNGKPYHFVARNYRPDHLAILPNQTGACSLQDGCGVLINEAEQLEPQTKSLLTRILEALRINAKTCPKCGMEMDGKECSECNYTENAFCSTGEGGGVDPSCGGEKGKGNSPSKHLAKIAASRGYIKIDPPEDADEVDGVPDIEKAKWYGDEDGNEIAVNPDGTWAHFENIRGDTKSTQGTDASSLTKRLDKLHPTENAMAPGVQRHGERGQFLPRGSGTGKGEQHTAAKVGFGRVCPTCGGALDDAGFCPTCPDDDEAEAEYKASLTDIEEPILASLNTDPTLEDLDY